jgi:hypothetical protein
MNTSIPQYYQAGPTSHSASSGIFRWVYCHEINVEGTLVLSEASNVPESDAVNSFQILKNDSQVSLAPGTVLIGYQLGGALTTGTNNVVVGRNSGTFLNTGSGEVLIGHLAAPTLTTGNNNVAIGEGAGTGLTTGSGVVAIGHLTSLGAANNFTVAIGDSASATGLACISIGKDASCAQDDCISIGHTATNIGVQSISIGQNVAGTGNRCIGIGFGINNSGTDGVAIGTGATVSNAEALAMGISAMSSGIGGIAIGGSSTCTSLSGIAVGHDAETVGINSISMGDRAVSRGTYNVTIGDGAISTALSSNSVAIGRSAECGHADAVVIGRAAQSPAANTFAIGALTVPLRVVENAPAHTNMYAPINIAAAVALTWQGIQGGIVTGTPGAAVALTTPAAADIYTNVMAGALVNQGVRLKIINLDAAPANTYTITAGDGNVHINGNPVIAGSSSAELVFLCTNTTPPIIQIFM